MVLTASAPIAARAELAAKGIGASPIDGLTSKVRPKRIKREAKRLLEWRDRQKPSLFARAIGSPENPCSEGGNAMPEMPVTDPDNVAEMLCNGPLHLSFQGHGPQATAILTFTQIRPDPAPLLQENTIKDHIIVRARIAMNIPNLIALRDVLVNNVRTEQDITQTGGIGSAVRH